MVPYVFFRSLTERKREEGVFKKAGAVSARNLSPYLDNGPLLVRLFLRSNVIIVIPHAVGCPRSREAMLCSARYDSSRPPFHLSVQSIHVVPLEQF